MKIIHVSALVLSAWAFGWLSHAQADTELDWELQRDRDGIQVFTRRVEDSKFKAVKSTMRLNTSLSALVALVRDAEACPEWADLCKHAEVVETVNAREMYVYTLNDLPWPVSDRDAVAHVLWQQDATSKVVTMTADAVDGKVPHKNGKIRLQYAATGWIFTPLTDGQIEITSHAHVDPAGAIPAWLTNRLLVDSPYKTMKAMRTLVETGRYDDTDLNFLTEP